MPMCVYKSCCHPVATMILMIYVDNNEAKLMVLASCCCTVVWARKLAIELGFSQLKPTNVYEDITGCISFANNIHLCGRSKHIALRVCFIQKLSITRSRP